MRFTVLIPTHDNGPVVRVAIDSVQRQTVEDWELFVVCDGAPPETVAAVEEAAEQDERIRSFVFPKGERHGEVSRHAALAHATGESVCYLSDDDFWFPDHLETMAGCLADHDFAHTRHTLVHPDYALIAYRGDLREPNVRQRMANQRFNRFGPSAAGHRLDAYRRLSVGWAPAPPDIWTDLHMWRKWLSADMRFTAVPVTTGLHLAKARRPGRKPEAALAEARYWSLVFEDPFMRQALRDLLPDDETPLPLADVTMRARRTRRERSLVSRLREALHPTL